MKRIASAFVAAIFLFILSMPIPAQAQCNCANASLMNTQVATQAGNSNVIPSTVTSSVELVGAGPLFGMAGPSPRMNVNYGANTIRVDFVQQPATYGAGYLFKFTNLNPLAPAGCTGTPVISGITVTTNKPGASFIAAGATFGPHNVTVPFTASTNLDWLPGEYILVTLQFSCPTTQTGGFNPCCPPWNSTQLQSLMAYQGTGGIAAPYTLHYNPTPAFNAQMNAYINYLTTLSLGFTSISIQFTLQDGGVGSTPGPFTNMVSQNVTWTGSGNPVANFFGPGLMAVNHWYRVQTNVILNGGPGTQFLPPECRSAYIDVRLQLFPSPLARGRGQGAAPPAVLQMRLPTGEVIEQRLDQGAPPQG